MASAAYIKFCNDVKSKTDIVELVREAGGKPRNAGRHQLLCCSPLRNESDPSFRIYVNQNSWWDYGAQQGGDVIDFVQAYRSVDFNGAIDILAERAGMTWGSGGGNGAGKRDPETDKQITRHVERRWVASLATEAAMYYHKRLSPKMREWLRDFYGFDDDIVNRQCVGWADGTLLDYMTGERGHSIKDLLKTGLFIRTAAGKIVEHHESRITFPYWRSGSAPYMISRRVDGVTPDTAYQKSKYKKTLTRGEDKHEYVSRHVRNDILYGEDSAQRHQSILVITEGVTDAITAIMCGWPVISPVTTRFSKDDIERLLRLSGNADKVVIINDNETPRPHERTGEIIQPGLDGARDTAHVLFEHGIDVRVGILPRPETEDKVDLNSFVRDHGQKALDPVVDKALPYPEFLIGRIPTDTRPAELDEKLSPVYDAIARSAALEREAYVNQIGQRFGLTKDTVTDAVDEFVRARGPLPPPPALPTVTGGASEPPLPPSSGDDDGSDPPSLPPHMPNMRGHIYVSADNYYYVLRQDKETGDFIEEPISDFVLEAKMIVQVEHGRQVGCDIFRSGFSHPAQRNLLLPPEVFSSTRGFKVAVQRNAGVSWRGSEHNVQAVFSLLNYTNVPVHQGVELVGSVHTKNGPRFVLPDRIIDEKGTCRDTNLVYAAVEPPAIASRLKMDGADMPESTIAKVAQRSLAKIFALNDPEVVLTLIGWFSAACIAPQIRAITRHFPIFWMWGTQGSGKSTLAQLLWMLFGVVGEPFSCGDTRFALMKNMCTTSSVPLLYDEYRGLTIQQREYFHRLLRENYIGGEMTRGRADQRTNKFRLLSPIVVIGELLPDDAAIMERMVCASPFKNTPTPKTSRLLRELYNEPLYQLGGHFHRWCLGVDVPELVARARAQMHATMLPRLTEPLPPRLRDNLLVVVVGNMLHEMWCAHLKIDIPDRPSMPGAFVKMVEAVTDTEDGGGVRDAFDRFLEGTSTYAHTGVLREGTHYALVDGQLCLHLDSCYQEYLKERRKANLIDETNGHKALLRVAREKQEAGSYVVDRGRRVRLGGRQVRCVVIDPTKVPEHLNVDEFPVQTNRVRGHQVPFGGWNSHGSN